MELAIWINSPTKNYIRIKNLDKITIEHNHDTVDGSFLLGTANVGSTLTNHGTAISAIQENISTINTDVSNLNNNKQCNITLVGGTNNTVTEHPNDTFTIDSPSDSNLLGTNNISVFNGPINLSSNISTNNCSLKNLFVDSFMNVSIVKLGEINGDAEFSNINHFNTLDFALAQNDNGQSI